MEGPIDVIGVELKFKYRNKKKVNGKWVYDYGDDKKKTPTTHFSRTETEPQRQAEAMAGYKRMRKLGISRKEALERTEGNWPGKTGNAVRDKVKKQVEKEINELDNKIAREERYGGSGGPELGKMRKKMKQLEKDFESIKEE